MTMGSKSNLLIVLALTFFFAFPGLSPGRSRPALSEILAASEYLFDGDIPEDISTTSGKTPIYVDPRGDDGNSGLSITAPKRHLGAALEYANAHPFTPFVIYLRGGTYYRPADYEYQRIERGDLIITTYPGEAVTIRPHFWPGNPSSWGEEVLFYSCGPYQNITIDGLTLQGWSNPFIFGSRFDQDPMRNLVIKNINANEFRKRGPDFITEFFSTDYVSEGYLPGPDDFDPSDPDLKYQIEGLILSRCFVEEVDIGINVGDEDDANVKGLRISEVEVRNSPQEGEGNFQDGFALVNCSQVLIDNCRIENAGDDGIDTKSFDVCVINTCVRGTYRNAVKFWHNGELINSIIYDCTPINDGAFIIGEGPARMIHSILMKKSVGYAGTFNYGSAASGRFEIVNSIFADLDHTFYVGGDDLRSLGSLYYDMPGGLFSGTADVETVEDLNLLADCSDNIAADPLLAHPAGGNFAPRTGTPLRDAGVSAGVLLPAFDYYGNPRIQGSAPDPGPIETVSPPLLEKCDYDGDGTSDIAVFRGGSGLWLIRGITRFNFGLAGDCPSPGDYNGDGTTDPGIYRSGSGLWAIRGWSRFYFGSSARPAPADYDGDGCCQGAVFRSGEGLWAVRDFTRVYYGESGDEPLPGDYDGDGTKDIGIFRGVRGLWALRDITRLYYGGAPDEAIPGDYDGNGTWSPSVFRPRSGLWAVRGLTRSYFGGLADAPVPADYDGDLASTPGIFRDSSGLWAVRNISRVYFGAPGDIPVTR
jgi:hypothetical protein